MNTLTYNLKNDPNTYVMTCNDEWLDMYMELLFENVTDLCEFMDTELHNYNEKYTNLDYKVKG